MLCMFRINGLVMLDGMAVVVTGSFAVALAVMITLGKNETCESVEKATADAGHP